MSTPESPRNNPSQPQTFVERVHNLRDTTEESLRTLREGDLQIDEKDIPVYNPFERARVYENTRRLLQYISADQGRLSTNDSVQTKLLQLKKFLDDQETYNDTPVVSSVLKNPGRTTAIIGTIIGGLAINRLANAIVNKEKRGVIFNILKFTGVVALSHFVISKFPVSPKDSELAPSVRGTVETTDGLQIHAQLLDNDLVIGGAKRGGLDNPAEFETAIKAIVETRKDQKKINIRIHCNESQKTDTTKALSPVLERLRTTYKEHTFELRLVSKKPEKAPEKTAT
jgi:uncharacterized membrane protein YeaQ/YmgE (transglycosylase-associated protein family)